MRPVVVLFAVVGVLWATLPAEAFELTLPIDCAMGETCFLQQGPDLDPGPGAVDPWCGGATYDGHDGTDIRLRALSDMAAGTPVIAAADGVVAGFRDGMADRLVTTDADRAAIANVECGNGVLLQHPDGWETQYCHMQQGSVRVAKGQAVKRGDVLGMIGASGMAQFPHMHLTVRKDGTAVDPFTGHSLDQGCDASGSATLWTADTQPKLFGQEGTVLDLGFAAGPVDHDALVETGVPAVPTAQSEALVAWAWFINLKQGDEVTVRLEAADGTDLSENTAPPLDRNKAAYSAFTGLRGAPAPGTYRVRAVVIRAGVPALSQERQIVIE